MATWPAIAPLLLWMLVPLAMTVYFSLIRYNLLSADAVRHFEFTLINYEYFLTDAAFLSSLATRLCWSGRFWLFRLSAESALRCCLAALFGGAALRGCW